VIVNHRPDPPPRRAPEPFEQPRGPRAIILPPNQRPEEREAFLAELEARHGDLIRREIARRRDVAPGSRDDVRQTVLLILCAEFEKDGPPDKPAALVRAVVDNAVRNHAAAKARRPRFDGDAEVDDAPTGTPDPEAAAIRAEQVAKLERYRSHLTQEESDVLVAREAQGLGFEEIAERMGLPRTTVFRLHAAAIEKLREQAAASDRAAARRSGR
jgi:RNA polymerase sigma factor (sigma-70 family)